MLIVWRRLASQVMERGATMTEYAIMVGLVALVSILVVGALGMDVFGQFDGAQSAFNGTGPGTPTP